MNDLLDRIFFDNTLGAWLSAVSIALLGTVALKTIVVFGKKHVGRLVLRTQTRLDDYLLAAVTSTRPPFIFGVPILVGASVVRMPPVAALWRERVLTALILFQVGLWLTATVKAWMNDLVARRAEGDKASLTTLSVVRIATLAVVWSVITLVFLDNLGVNITALVAGLGVGGVALALAVQGLLSDLVASLVIVLDKPFVIGDFIVVGDMSGTVEQIGLKTTRIRSLGGEQLVFSHSDLLGSRIRNYKRMTERRVVFTLGLVYQTSQEQLELAPKLVRQIVEAQPKARFERCHFLSYGDSSLGFEVVYFVLDPDYGVYADVHQAVNLAIFRAFAAAKIEFAYPTQTLHVAGAEVAAAPTTLRAV